MRSEISGSKFRAIKFEYKNYTNLRYYTYTLTHQLTLLHLHTNLHYYTLHTNLHYYTYTPTYITTLTHQLTLLHLHTNLHYYTYFTQNNKNISMHRKKNT